MIVGLGVDLVENRRFQRELARGEWLREEGIFSGEEILYCRAGKQVAQRYAACFAAKEAVLKALGVGVKDVAIFREVEVRPGLGSECRIVLHARLQSKAGRLGLRRINLSISAAKKQTAAMVVLES